jgi:hypothetical protein
MLWLAARYDSTSGSGHASFEHIKSSRRSQRAGTYLTIATLQCGDFGARLSKLTLGLGKLSANTIQLRFYCHKMLYQLLRLILRGAQLVGQLGRGRLGLGGQRVRLVVCVRDLGRRLR